MARWLTVASLSFPGGSGKGEERVASAREEALKWIDRAAQRKPDLIVLPETFAALGLSGEEWLRTAEPVPGPTTEALAQKARQYCTYILCPLVQREGDRFYNAAVLLGRRGEVVGIYHKMFPTLNEISVGITPGHHAVVWETDFGRVGCAICFDLNFSEVIQGLAANAVELVLFPSMYRGGLQTQIWSHDFSVYFVSATPGEGSVIVNPLGRLLGASSHYERILVRRLNLDCFVGHIDYNHLRWEAIWEKYGPGIEIEVASPEAKFLLTSHLPDRTAKEIAQEFELLSLQDYFLRARRTRQEALSR